ncbi:hypothetical protein QBK99_05250 [Corticibacterium sp. UT-5YL-CI-8]|nr:hypothetical protein [Tianweitania sp. UT-5YL-CI-8]
MAANPRVQGLWLLLAGVGIGGILGSGLSKRWGTDIAELFSSPNFATLLAGVLGAVIGGLISYFIANQTASATEQREKTAALIAERASAFSCMVTTMQLANGLFTLNGYLQEAATPPEGNQPWQMLQATAGTTAQAAAFKPSDFSPFINAGRADIVHRALLLAERYHSLEAGLRSYSERRIELEEFLLPLSTFSEGAMTSAIPEALLSTASYRMTGLNQLITSMAGYCSRDLHDAKEILQAMNDAFTSYFGEHANFRLNVEPT